MAAIVLRFISHGLFSVGFSGVSSLSQQAQDNPTLKAKIPRNLWKTGIAKFARSVSVFQQTRGVTYWMCYFIHND